VARIWVRRSGEAATRNQILESGEKAIWVCVRAEPRKVPLLRRRQFAQLQFHWGKPPPAAEPRTLMRMVDGFAGERRSRAGKQKRPLQKAAATVRRSAEAGAGKTFGTEN